MNTVSTHYIELRVGVDPASGCWNWLLHLDRNGYGVASFGRNKAFAHRLSFAAYKEDPGELFVCHKCDNPACVNPDHLFAGTNLDNVRDMHLKGRNKTRVSAGEKNPNHKVSAEQVALIRSAKGTQEQIAEQFGISQSQVSKIRRGTSWSLPRAQDN